ncbi:hypothetical protein VPNG_09063 [Cytospora leucostoma]|uniref:DUF7707 domain-containing protein n=1 Tax=Cytospora leucostoma TaxID=1230097 RepID=A0A423VZA7_9PEZI|nr:hypothetical protein VPNG_09063 [Cytospora leucostoma]
MPSFKTSFLAMVAAIVATVQADYYITPSSVPLDTRKTWCNWELSTCPVICEDQSHTGASVNTCDADTLSYGCLCGDGTRPNVSEYSLTLPYFVCTEWGNQCVTACGQNNTCSSACRDDHPCGALDPTPANATATGTASSTASSSTADSTTIYSGPAGGSSSKSGASRPPSFEMVRLYSTAGMLGLFCLGFAYLL